MTPPAEHAHPAEAAARRRAIVLRVVRAAFFILMITFSLLAALQQQQSDSKIFTPDTSWWVPVGLFLAVAVFLYGAAIAVDIATPQKKIATITGVMFGIIAGVLATAALGFIIDLLLESWVQDAKAVDALKPIVNFVKVLMGITFCYIGVTTVLQTQDDFRLVIPYVEFAKQIRGVRPLLIDSSVLIDGRIIDIAGTGFLQAPLIIPRFVVAELQTLADSQDSLKRAKGRRGLDYIARLQRTPRIDVSVDETPVPGKSADQMLVEMARTMPALILTTDVALAQVARIENIGVLSINDLANALKSSVVAGESISVKLLRAGEQPGQAVGYLPDGAMVVAENGEPLIGKVADLTVISSLQTSAGRLIFARHVAPQREGGAPQGPADSDRPHQDAADTTNPADGPAQGPAAEGPEVQSHDEPPGSKPPEKGGGTPPQGHRPLRPGTPRNPRR
ncbi:MAG: hypothetical protein KF864_03880 [Phycisphaeraceae bacterium]|nr:hypothetical protein [Phycisphaeraceae bacterium]